MRAHWRSLRATALLGGAVLTAAGCSFLSSADDLSGSGGGPGALGAGATSSAGSAGSSAGATSTSAGAGGSSGSLGGGGTGAGGSAGAGSGGASGAGLAGSAGASGAPGGGAGSGQGGAAGQPTSGGSAGQSGESGSAGQSGASGAAGAAGQGASPTGAIVMGGVVSGNAATKDVLVLLDPATGKERSREDMVVAAIAHEVGLDGDRWFIFESKGFAEPTPTDEVVLHVRTLDLASGAWNETKTVKVPSLVIGSVVVLNNRLAYLGYVPNSASQRRLVVIDTTPAMLGEIAVSGDNAYTTATASGLVGIRSASTPGGTLDVVGVTAAPCTLGTTPGFCDVSLRPVTVDGAGAAVFAAKKAASFAYSAGAQATWTASTANNEVYIAFPGSEGAQPFLRRFSPAGVTALGQPLPFDASGRTFRSMAFDECNGLAFLTELNADQAVFAIPVKKVATAGVQSLGKPGQRVLYEPSTHAVLVPFSQGGVHSLRAFTVDAASSPPTMTERPASSWSPPDIAPGPIAVRAGFAGACD